MRRAYCRSVGLLAVLCWCVCVVCAPTVSGAAKGPRIKFAEVSHDFGILRPRGQASHTFIFHNVGDEPLQLGRVRTSCGCTVAEYTKTPVPPGGEGFVKVTFSAGSRTGRQVKKVQVPSNDPTTPTTVLEIRADVKPLIVVTPHERIYLQSFSPRSGAKKTLSFMPTQADGLTILGYEATPPSLSVKLTPKTVGGKTGCDAEITVPSGLPYGPLSGRVIFQTNLKEQPTIVVTLSGNVASGVKIYPTVLRLGEVWPGQKLKREILVSTSKEKGWVRILGVAEEHSALEAEVAKAAKVRTRVAGSSHTIFLKVKPDAPPGVIKGGVEIFLNDPDRPYFLLPVYGAVASSFRVQPEGIFFELPADAKQNVATILITRNVKPAPASLSRSGQTKEEAAPAGPLEIGEVEFDQELFEVQVAQEEEGNVKISVALRSPVNTRPLKTEIKVHAKKPTEEVLTIPVRAARTRDAK